MYKVARMSDVAKLAGVSTMTVSRVLNQNVHVSHEISKRVLAAVDKLEYQRNELARSLRARRSRQIGILVPYLFDPFFAACAHFISTVAKEHAYSVVLSTSNEDPHLEFEEASRMVRRNVDGIIVIPAAHPVEDTSFFLGGVFHHLPIVALDRPVHGDQFDCLLVENRHGACIGTEHLLALGHKEIVLFMLSNDVYTMRMRELGHCDAMRNAGLEPTIVHLTPDLNDTKLVVRQLLESNKRPSAVFCANNLLTRHVLHSLQDLGLHPPHPIALVGFDDFDTADLLSPGITTIRQPVEKLGRTAAEILFTRLKAAASAESKSLQSCKQTVLPVELIVRGSCGSKVLGPN